jgi:hypothetical protein
MGIGPQETILATFSKSLVITILLGGIPLSAQAKDDICGIRTMRAGTVFSMSIARSRVLKNAYVEFELCERSEPSQSFLLIRTGTERPKKLSETRQLRVDQTAYLNLVAMYERALDYDVKDDALGNDGSSWCLETTRGFTYSRACFWSPEYNTNERHLTGMLALGRELWHLAGMEADRLF